MDSYTVSVTTAPTITGGSTDAEVGETVCLLQKTIVWNL